MLARLYVDNYKVFSNFELPLSGVQLLLGQNGTGKSCVLEVMAGLQALVIDGDEVVRVFDASTLAAWSKARVQVFELQVSLGDEAFVYRLEIEQVRDGSHALVKAESLKVGSVPLFGFSNGDVQLFKDDGSPGPTFPARKTRSGLAFVAPGPSNPRLQKFREWLEAVLLIRPNPARIGGIAPGEDARLDPSLANFASWYRQLQLARPRAVVKALQALEAVIIGFEELVVEVDQTRTGYLRVGMKGPSGTYRLDFERLSDGQRVLFALYTVLHAAADGGRLVLFDEPDNYVALAELQPFLNELLDRALGAGGPQVVLISHHPEFINPLAPERGVELFREQAGPTRVRRFQSDALLTAAEVIARGGAGA